MSQNLIWKVVVGSPLSPLGAWFAAALTANEKFSHVLSRVTYDRIFNSFVNTIAPKYTNSIIRLSKTSNSQEVACNQCEVCSVADCRLSAGGPQTSLNSQSLWIISARRIAAHWLWMQAMHCNRKSPRYFIYQHNHFVWSLSLTTLSWTSVILFHRIVSLEFAIYFLYIAINKQSTSSI